MDRDIGYNRPLPPIAVGNDVLVASYSECVFGSQQVWTLSRLGPDGHRVWQRGFVQPPTWLPDEVANGGLRGLAIGGTSLFALGTLDALFTLKKLDPATGAVAWSVSRADTPRMLTALPNGDAIVYVNSLTAMRVSGTDGSVLWQAPMPVSWIEETTSSSATQPVRNYAVALDTSGDNIVRSGSSIYRVNSADGSIVWNKTLPGFSENARFVADHFGYPYVVTRGTDEVILTKLISVDGSPVFTKHYSVPGIVSVPSNVTLASDDVVCWSEIRADGRLWVVGASTADGTLKWSAKLGGLNAATVVSPYVNLAVAISGIAFVVGTSGVDNPAQFTGCLDLPHHSRLWLKIGMPYKSFHYWVTVTGDDSAVVTGTDWAVEQSARIAKAIRYRAR